MLNINKDYIFSYLKKKLSLRHLFYPILIITAIGITWPSVGIGLVICLIAGLAFEIGLKTINRLSWIRDKLTDFILKPYHALRRLNENLQTLNDECKKTIAVNETTKIHLEEIKNKLNYTSMIYDKIFNMYKHIHYFFVKINTLLSRSNKKLEKIERQCIAFKESHAVINEGFSKNGEMFSVLGKGLENADLRCNQLKISQATRTALFQKIIQEHGQARAAISIGCVPRATAG